MHFKHKLFIKKSVENEPVRTPQVWNFPHLFLDRFPKLRICIINPPPHCSHHCIALLLDKLQTEKCRLKSSNPLFQDIKPANALLTQSTNEQD